MKCILLVRVSTESQSYDEQERELYQLAQRDGYKKDEIVSIAEKESGIRLSEEERQGLNKMKELISTGEFDCVYAWEVTRIARKKKVLFSIVDFLVGNHIQLIIKEPSLCLLKADGSIDEGAETIFTLYSQLGEAEMRNKMARFKRAKKAAFNKGKYMGGKYLTGYTVNKEGYWVIDPESSQLVKLIFELYLTGEYSMLELAKELVARGYFKSAGTLTNVKNRLSQILRNEAYIGKRKNNNLYPPIIDADTWSRVAKRRTENKHLGAKKAQRLLSAMIKCKCGASYSANLLDCTYCCRVRHNSVEKGIIHSPSINLNMAESLAWYVALSAMQEDSIIKRGIAKEDFEQKIKVLEQKIGTSQGILDSVSKRRADLDENYFVFQRFTKDRYEELSKKMNEVVDAENAHIRDYNGKIATYRKQIQAETTFDDVLNQLHDSFEDLKGGTDIDLMRQIVRRYINEIHIEEIPDDRSAYYHKKVVFNLFEADHYKMDDLGLSDLDFLNNNEFYIDTLHKKAFFDENFSNEVPMHYIEFEKRRRVDTRKKRRLK